MIPSDDNVRISDSADIELNAAGFIAGGCRRIVAGLPTAIVGGRSGIVRAAS